MQLGRIICLIKIFRLLKYCLINEQECFIMFKGMHERAARVALDLIKHDLRVY